MSGLIKSAVAFFIGTEKESAPAPTLPHSHSLSEIRRSNARLLDDTLVKAVHSQADLLDGIRSHGKVHASSRSDRLPQPQIDDSRLEEGPFF